MLPALMYGTAWKEEETERLVLEALRAGFRGIDTANQRKHYHEAGAAAGLRRFRQEQPDAQIFVQTKFTYQRGQDHRLPYDPAAPLPQQLRQSFALSRERLGAIDSYLLHGPELSEGLTSGDWLIWREMEALHQEGQLPHLGISNVNADQLRALVEGARVRPSFVQNRCYAKLRMDREVREVCEKYGVLYQGFSILTANRALWGDKRLFPMARRLGGTPAQVLFLLARHLRIFPLIGTTDPAHMRADLACLQMELTEEELQELLRMVGA